MTKSESIDQLAAALARAQAEMKNPLLDETADTGKFTYRYVSLAALRNAVIPVLARHDLSVAQFPVDSARGPALVTLLMHKSGQWIEGDPLCIPVSQPNAQGVGSALTYARRYALQALAGVVGDDDDDGAAASRPAPAKEKANGHQPVPAPAPKKTGGPVAPKDGAEMEARLSAYDLKCADEGLCERGAVVKHVLALGKANKQPPELVRWAAPWLVWALQQAAKFADECRAKQAAEKVAEAAAIAEEATP